MRQWCLFGFFVSVACGIWWIGGMGLVLLCACVPVCFDALDALCLVLCCCCSVCLGVDGGADADGRVWIVLRE